jgi:hypothetical protein
MVSRTIVMLDLGEFLEGRRLWGSESKRLLEICFLGWGVVEGVGFNRIQMS